MVQSMTGFARAECNTDAGVITLELRAVNHRFLEINMRMPEELRRFEMKIRERINKKLNRGKIDCNVRLQGDAGAVEAVEVNEAFAKSLLATVENVSSWMSDPAKLSPLQVMNWPGVVEEQAPDIDVLGKDLTSALNTALRQLVEMRGSEGERMADHIRTRLDGISASVVVIRGRRKEVVRLQKEKMHAKLADLNVDVDSSRLEQEVVMMAQKLDVDEELDRLDSHVEAVREALDKKEPIGRRLDFLMQEFNREANTLGSKSSDSETTQAAVELKVMIEQMREQIQNIE